MTLRNFALERCRYVAVSQWHSVIITVPQCHSVTVVQYHLSIFGENTVEDDLVEGGVHLRVL